jgi:hypothetical protein
MPTSGAKQQRTSQRSSRPRPRDSESELGRFEPVTDAQILAAVERGEVHNERENKGVLRSDLAEHLGFVHNGWTTRQLRPQLDGLRSAGLLQDLRRHGLDLLAITSDGRRALAKARCRGDAGGLPESPQHRRWRHSRAAAADRIDGFRLRVRGALDETQRLLDAEQTTSDAWFDLAERLTKECWQLGSATYCLTEWAEPEDSSADTDDGARFRGRRNVWQWEAADSPR